MSLIDKLPDLDWSDTARDEIANSGAGLLSQCEVAYRIGDIGVVGLIYPHFLSPPWMCFALAKGVSVGDLIDFRRLALLIPSGTRTAIRADFPVGVRFAKLYGFKSTGSVALFRGFRYEIFRRD